MNKYLVVFLASLSIAGFAVGGQAQAASSPDGTLVVDPQGTVFLIKDGARLPFRSPAVFFSYNYDFQYVVKANADDLALPVGSVVKFKDGTLIKDPNTPQVYLIADGKKLAFESAQAFLGLGYSFKNLVVSSPETFADIPAGQNISTAEMAHPVGTLINQDGTIYVITTEGRKGYSSYDDFVANGESLARVVPANSADRALSFVGIVSRRLFLPGIYEIVPSAVAIGDAAVIRGFGFTGDNTINFGALGYIKNAYSSDNKSIKFTVPSTIDRCPPGAVGCILPQNPVTPGVYPISVTNIYGSTNQVWLTVRDKTSANQAPSIPIISGPTSTGLGVNTLYSALSTDPDGDDITYTFSWGDGSYKDNKSFGSGNAYFVYHTWTKSDTYSVAVEARDTKGAASQNVIYVRVGDAAAPKYPVNVTIAGAIETDGSAKIYWEHATAEKFKIYKNKNDGAFQFLATTSDKFYKDTGLGNGTKYGYYVTAINAYGESGPSSKVYIGPVSGVASLQITTQSMPRGTAGQTYSFQFQASGGTPPYTWTSISVDNPYWCCYIGISYGGAFNSVTQLPTSGTYQAGVKVTDARGNSVQKVFTYVIDPAAGQNTPPARPQMSLGPSGNITVATRQTFNFTATDAENDQLSYIIRWGDSTSDSTASGRAGSPVYAEHTWAQPGTYTISVSVNDGKGGYNNNTFSVTVVSAATGSLAFSRESFDFAYTSGATMPASQSLTMTNTSNTTVAYTLQVTNQPTWLVSSYSSQTLTSSAGSSTGIGASVNPANLSAGTYTASLVISGNFIGSPKTIPITLTILPAASSPLQVTTTQMTDGSSGSDYSFQFQASGGVPPYRWSTSFTTHPCCYLTLDPESGIYTNVASGSAGRPVAGTWQIGVRVTDGRGTNAERTFTWVVRSPNRNPATPTVSGASAVTTGVSNQFSAVSSDPEGEDITYTFNWGDGSQDSVTSQSGSSVYFNHAWSSAGNYTLIVTAGDSRGGSSQYSFPVTVSAPPSPSPAYYAGLFRVNSVFCGQTFIFRVDNYSPSEIWLEQTVTRNAVIIPSKAYRGSYTVPTTYTTSCSRSDDPLGDIGFYLTSVYALVSGQRGNLLGSTTFEVKATAQ